jgi:hypothetical protein
MAEIRKKFRHEVGIVYPLIGSRTPCGYSSRST